MKAATYVGLVLACSLFASTAQATENARFVTDILFQVDGNVVASLESHWPIYGPIKLAGRSGPCGDDERSGLYDNAIVVYFYGGSHGIILLDAPFDSLATSVWGLYGGPSPHLLMDFGNPSPCLMTSGDSSYESGVYSLDDSVIPGGGDSWFLQVDVHVGSTADFHGIAFGIGADDAPSGPPGEQTLGHKIGVTWTNNGQGENVLQCVTDLEYEEVPAAAWIGGWHTVGFACPRPTPVEAASWTRVKALFR